VEDFFCPADALFVGTGVASRPPEDTNRERPVCATVYKADVSKRRRLPVR
ncbi:uncharacterized protein METZ01_LOCUS220595, partial [marine metagenome]